MAEPADQGPYRSQSTTSLSRLYHGANGYSGGDEGELSDPRLDFCNAFWGHGDKGYEVMMARLRGAARTMEELKSFGRERAAIEEEYAKKLAKLAKAPLGKDEIGDLAASLQNVQSETANQASYHLSLATELRQNVEQPTAEFVARLANLKKGLQASVEKSYKNKGLQEGHVLKAKDRYESDCLKLNSYTANAALSQGKDLEKINSKLERVRQTIGANEQDFRQFVKVLEGTAAKWESEWKAFCDHVQDLEEDRLALTKDIVWAYANAVSQVCVEDDSSCERVREKLEQFEPQNDMLNFVRGWGTGDTIPNPPRFVNYSAGESYPSQPGAHVANFRRLSSKPPPSASSQQPLNLQAMQVEQAEEPPMEKEAETNGWTNGISKLSLNDEPKSVEKAKVPVGGVALPGMAAPAPAAASATASRPDRTSSMPPPPVPPAMTMPEPRVPSRQSTRDMNEDPMAKALAELRREPPPSGSVRRNASQRRPESVYSTTASSAKGGSNIKSPPSPGPGASNRMSYQQAPSRDTRGSVDMTLSPPAPGHTAAQLQKSMDDFHRQSQAKRGSVNYSNYANDVVGAHPSSRPSSPAPGSRGPSSAMMQPPIQPPSPVADEVLSQYHQAFPGERSRSRAGSITSGRSRAGSFVGQPPANIPQSPSAAPREGFVGIGAGGGRSPSPQPPAFRSPSPSPVVSHAPGVLGPQNLGIALDEKGGVAHDSMAEAYRRQYQQQQAQQQSSSRSGRAPSPAPIQSPRSPVYAQQPQQQQQQYPAAQQAPYGQQAYAPAQLPPKSPVQNLPPSISTQTRPMSGFAPQSAQGYQTAVPPPQAHAQQPYQPQQPPQQYPGYQSPQQQPGFTPYGQQPSYQSPPVPQAQPAAYQSNGYGQHPQQQPQRQSTYGAPQQQYQPPPQQQQQYARAPSPAPQPQPQQQQQYYAGRPSPQPGYGSQQAHGRSPSPQPNRPPENTAPTGQWSTTGQPVLFYVKALYDYQACSPAEFDFQAGDIIAVTSTPEDGWWSGELLDEARRRPGQTDFPSNFVCLF